MPLETNFNTTPYWDDFNEDKDFYKILFKPGVALQTRELNQLQTILQKQVERFGDHVFKSGTIVSGVNFNYNPLLAYAKIKDLQEDGQPVNPQDYVGLFVKNSANLQAIVVNYASGFESKSPDLNTIFLQYTNSGNTFGLSAFSNDDVLEIFSKENNLFDVDVNNGGLGFANSDSLQIISALTVQVASGTFTNGEIFTQATSGARQQIVGIANGSTSNTKILSIKPINAEQLANTSANSTTWTISTGYNITGNTSSAVANVISQIGSGATGSIITDSLGVVQNIVLSNGGANYTTLPKVVIKPASASASVSTLDLEARTYKAKIRVVPGTFAAPVGFGYSFGVTEGVIYQKGTFSRVIPQNVIVSKYSTSPNNISVGFTSNESIVKNTTDSSLYDNAANTYNETAPGADRLRIRPTLFVVNTDVGSANSEFLSLVEFSEGVASKENRNTIYNQLAKEFETRTFESSGNFVIDPFRSSTKEKVSNTTHISVVVDPGTAYISGKRVETSGNLSKDVQKSNTVFSKANQTITANYGNYVVVKELAGFFDFKSGTTVNLYDTAKTLLTSVTTGTITPAGNSIGTAKMRSIVYQSGTVGTPNATYRLYLFDVTMNAGKSFRDVKSFYFDGTYDGICDAVLEADGTSGANIAILNDTNNPDIIFKTGVKAVKSISDISYTYRTSTENLTLNANGTIEITSPVTYTFPYSGSINLSTAQKADFIIAPVSNTNTANTTGTSSGNTTSANVVGTSTTFATDYAAGDYISVYTNAVSYDVKRVENVVNNTLIILNSALTAANNSTNTALFFPAFYPLDLSRSARTITTSANAAVVTVNLGESLTASANVVAFYNIRIPSAVQINKDLNRDLFVKIYTGNNASVSASGNNTGGPWSLGIPDTFRLKNVFFGNTASDTDVTKHFYVNSYNDGDIVRNAELKLVPGSDLSISNTQWLLAKFDAFDVNASEGFITINSYNDIINDATGYSNNTFINRLEVPEVLTSDGRYYDGIDVFDFRPFTSNTAAYSTTVGSATVNPANTQALNSDEKYFPVPDSQVTFDIEFFGSRIDRVVVNKNTLLSVIQGAPDVANLKDPGSPADSITVNRLFVPPYPSLPSALSNTTFQILDKRAGNDTSIINGRQKAYTIENLNSSADTRSQPKRYSMSQINKLEKRIDSLEKQVALNTLEKQITELIIPSSNDTAKNRFKNAFLVDNFDDAFVVDRSSLESTAYIDSVNSELLPITTIFNVESIFDRSDAATANNIHQNKTLLLPYEEYAFVSQLSASEPRVVRSVPAPIEVSSPVQDSGVVTYTQIDDYVYVPPADPITVVVANPTVVVANTTVVVPPPPPKPAMVRVVTDGSVEYYEANYVSDFYYNNKDWVDARYDVQLGAFLGGMEAAFEMILTSKVSLPVLQSTPAEVIVVTTTIDPPQTQTTSEPYFQVTDANAEEWGMTRDTGGGKYVEDFSHMQY
jgi:hypothetical protein